MPTTRPPSMIGKQTPDFSPPRRATGAREQVFISPRSGTKTRSRVCQAWPLSPSPSRNRASARDPAELLADRAGVLRRIAAPARRGGPPRTSRTTSRTPRGPTASAAVITSRMRSRPAQRQQQLVDRAWCRRPVSSSRTLRLDFLGDDLPGDHRADVAGRSDRPSRRRAARKTRGRRVMVALRGRLRGSASSRR